MDVPVHRIPQRMFAELSEGEGGTEAVGLLAAAQHSKHVLLIRQVVESARAACHEQFARVTEAYDLLADIQDRYRDAVDAVVRHPPVGAWARHTIRMLGESRTRAGAAPGQLGALAAAAAIRSGTDISAEVPVSDGAVMLPSLGRIAVPPHAAVRDRVKLNIANRRAEAAGAGWSVRIPADPPAALPGWQGLRQLSASARGKRLQILIEDLDDYRMPGSANVSARLSGPELLRWQSALHDAWELLTRNHEAVAAEAAAAIRAFTPLMPPPRGQVSATSRDTFGSVALSTPPDACSLAVTLAHEIQHAKLSALLDIVPMLLPDDGARYYAPWRDDPRPLSGLLQGAYAFLGVAGFWRRQRDAARSGVAAIRANTEFARWREAVNLVVGTLAASGRLTAHGEIFIAGMARTLRSLATEPVPADAVARAQRAAEQHRAGWIRANGQAAARPGGQHEMGGAEPGGAAR
jgi:HEXXH motif-containing protein